MKRNDLSYYDQWATEWWQKSATVAPLNRLNPLRFQFFDRYIQHWQDLKVLDVGCGGGFTCEFLAGRGAQVTGVDQSAACVRAASRHADEAGLAIAYKQAQAERLPFTDACFDAVVCVDVLEHVEDVAQTIAEIGRVLRPGGWFCFDTINRTWQSKLVMIWLLENTLRQIPRGVHDWQKFITPAELSALLEQQQMKLQALSGFDLFGAGILGKLRRLYKYQKTGKFQIDFTDGNQSKSNSSSQRVMYIGVATKGVAAK
ncbi:bifunctional 2-polyprenyl-6-hydroxyphenol methylase/3-demethylubiquinol 3-O-methyltransferase UbiG [cf. Phormidesmis sp. LEGE 11477]|uniref:bifunctional 2-polyprenyl-6-hydroxyphenol methylase/3-demethylubiquinol 3-O-methyltransferase UbiG n=1 Tax=cf. Phormidesmis sp. LEGE 11477 TaxID=1828680 RepID=UPI00187EC2DF|nr:bifunctional 2-polyprenyl-6-hydroxyphenol methylase/3-demethylubiquinol 3-O-methyltransferase UbiG [cf. Phormidesmis sp. LEGE 11477]MBE9063923.1 3-demethylubiquinone-9 3-O-methyltransferase [cf. Phormidesmis sp. LEGE 11477]